MNLGAKYLKSLYKSSIAVFKKVVPRINLFSYSQNPENAVWTKQTPTFGSLSTSVTPPSGFGGTGVSIDVGDDVGSIYQTLTLTAGTYTLSCYVQNVTNGNPNSVSFIRGPLASVGIADTGSTWTRISTTFTLATGSTSNYGVSVTDPVFAQGFFYGFQIEAGSTMTTYQPTTA